MIRRFIESIYGSRKRYTIAFVGLSWTGKTTLLYQLKLGQALKTTIPTIGINVEECEIQTAPGKTLNAVCWDLGLGCGSVRRMLGMFRHTLATANAVVWLVDCSTIKDELEASVEAFEEVLNSTPESKNLPVLVLATKYSDSQGPEVIDAIRLKFAGVLKARSTPYFIFPVDLLQDLSSPSSGVIPAFDWLHLVLEWSGKPQLSSSSMSEAQETLGDELSERLEEWLVRASKDTPGDEFLSQFYSVNLPLWDHYTHIRIAYLILLKHGRQKGKNMIFDGIKKYIEESPQGQTRKRTFHFTMTYFWVQMVHFSIRSIAPVSAEAEVAEGESGGVQQLGNDANDDFRKFLLLNPYLARSDLWSEYYTKDMMLSQEAKESMVLPDRNSLPNLVTQDFVDRVRMHF
ncbi:hypothetical protein AAF712_002895 [Marasmius tenuissimus]|uniref:Uncharacterized protein n=1 Tax=Marasmius tenuissimus TaxID=585030 RepID=A0ABR3A8T3_9AGAR